MSSCSSSTFCTDATSWTAKSILCFRASRELQWTGWHRLAW
jgi:hypothetical protein